MCPQNPREEGLPGPLDTLTVWPPQTAHTLADGGCPSIHSFPDVEHVRPCTKWRTIRTCSCPHRASAWLGDRNLFVPDFQAWGLGAEFPEFVPLVIGMKALITIIATNVDHSPSAKLRA